MKTRRDIIKTGIFAGIASATGSAMWPQQLFANSPVPLLGSGKVPTRFVFITKSNGLLPEVMVPPSFDEATMAKEKAKGAYAVDLASHTLPTWMEPIAGHKENLTILQGLSGKMCTVGHHTWCSALGAMRANERLSSVKWATVDFELAKLFPSPFEHIELACFPVGGGNKRGNINGIDTGFSARGAQQPNYAYGSPKVAMDELFKSVSTKKAAQVLYEMDGEALKFVAGNQGVVAEQLEGIERMKVQNYAESVGSIIERNRKVEAMADRIRKNVPNLPDRYLDNDSISTLDRQDGLCEILMSTLVSGMTNVISFTVDELGTSYTGLPKIEDERVNIHEIGHGKGYGGMDALTIREGIRLHHMKLVDRIVTRLKATPEIDGKGSMFDNTVIIYLPNNGETHHSLGTEWPFLIVAGDNAPMNIGRRYMRFPNYGDKGHKTIGNLYTTLLNVYGNPIEHYGATDTALDKFGIDQKGAIKELLA
jgi:hypothetical protein